ncbi:MAG: thiamine diphosphokinase [Ilumatobacteraceae bacterium]|nr:thiamine diphosphokinase [Ilumatobacteraceae bacterium]
MATSHTLIFIGGDPPHPNVRQHLPTDAYVIAADSGYAHAIALGFMPNELVGDMDSITSIDLIDAHDSNVLITQFPADKNLTDTEIAISSALTRLSSHISVVSGGGDRFDHVLGMVHSLALCAETVDTTLFIGTARVSYASYTREFHLDTQARDIISLIPLGGDTIVTTTGLQWELTSDRLQSFASRGVSNIATGTAVSISVDNGTLAIIQPTFLNHGDFQ